MKFRKIGETTSTTDESSSSDEFDRKRLKALKQTASTVARHQREGAYPKGHLYALVNLVRILADIVVEAEERRLESPVEE